MAPRPSPQQAADAPTTTTTTTTTTRFPPEPSYPIDLGHVKAALCVDAFAHRRRQGHETETGAAIDPSTPRARARAPPPRPTTDRLGSPSPSWILRFDDTNPRACAAGGSGGASCGRVASSIASYLRELPLVLPANHRPSKVTFASDYFLDMYASAEALIKQGHAYVDEDPPLELRQRRLKGEPSPWRGRAAEASLAAWRRMQRGEACENALASSSSSFFGVLRLAFPNPPSDPNAAMRDPVAFRVVLPPTGGDEAGGEGEEDANKRALHWRWDAREREMLQRLCSDDAGAAAGAEEDDEDDDTAFARRRPRAIPLPPPPPWLAPLYAPSSSSSSSPPPPPPPPLVFPTYDFACPFLDARERVLFALRTREFRDRDAQHAQVQRLLFSAAKAEAPENGGKRAAASWLWGGEEDDEATTTPTPTTVLEFSKILFPGLPLDKPSLRAITEAHGGDGKEGACLQGGYTDPRLPTLAGLLRGGCDPRALRQVLLEQALPEGRAAPKGAAGGSWAKLWSVNRAFVGRRAPRHMAVVLDDDDAADAVVVELVSPSPSSSSAPRIAAGAGAGDEKPPPPLTFRTAPLPKGGHTLQVLDRPREVRLSPVDAALLSPGETFTLLGLGAARLLPLETSPPPAGQRRLRAELLLPAEGGGGSDQQQQQEDKAKSAPHKFAWVPGPSYDRVLGAAAAGAGGSASATAGASVPIRVLSFSSPYPRHLAAGKPVLARAAASPSIAAAVGSAAASPPVSPSSSSSSPSPSPLLFDSPLAIARAFDAAGSKHEARGWADAALGELAARADSEGRCWGSDERLALARAGQEEEDDADAAARPSSSLPLAPPPAPAVVQFLRMGNFLVDRVDYDEQGKVSLVTLIAIPDGRESVWHAPATTTKAGG